MTRTMTADLSCVSVKLYVPSRYIGEALPLLVMLHGCTQSPDETLPSARE
jgi:poly(3-hydroxybutyrate) depolymerase